MKKCKVYSDGSHYIAIRPTEGYSGPRRKPPPEEPIIVEEARHQTCRMQSWKSVRCRRDRSKRAGICPNKRSRRR